MECKAAKRRAQERMTAEKAEESERKRKRTGDDMGKCISHFIIHFSFMTVRGHV